MNLFLEILHLHKSLLQENPCRCSASLILQIFHLRTHIIYINVHVVTYIVVILEIFHLHTDSICRNLLVVAQ